jgi:hypothetical protein
LALPPRARKPCRIVPYDEAPVKNVNSDRDSFVGRLLAETLEVQGAPVPDGSCLDAGTLAAWADDTLGAHERVAVEAHAAGCARCQALLAVMMKTAPPAVAEKSVWRIPAIGWLIPLTAAAAAVLVWAIVPRRATLPLSERAMQVASDRPVAVPSDRPAAVADQVGTLARSAPSSPRAKSEAQLQTQLKPPRAPTDITASPSASRGQRDASPVEGKAAIGKLENLDKSDQRVAVTPGAKEPSQGVIVAGRERVEGAAVAAAPPASGSVATFASRVALGRSGAAGTVIISSNQASRWRIAPAGAVERSTDGGATWQPQETGATATLAAGASPSPSVCWLVGPTGTVLRSTDGRTWRRIAFPEATDLISVRATDENIAAVTTLDGRTFSTSDGGLTWSRSGTQ